MVRDTVIVRGASEQGLKAVDVEIPRGAFTCAPPARWYDVPLDGQRSYVVKAAAPSAPVVTHINIIDNWFEELKAKVPRQ